VPADTAAAPGTADTAEAPADMAAGTAVQAGMAAGIAAQAGTVADMAGIAGKADRVAAGQPVAVPVFAHNRPNPLPQDIAALPAARDTVPASRTGERRCNLVRAVLALW